MKEIFHLALFLVPIVAPQQPSPPTDLTQILQHLAATADALTHSLPSFTCQETVLSQRIYKKKIQQQTNFTANLRVNRAEDGSLSESFAVLTLNGQPFSGGSFNMPTYVSGGFDRAILYFSSSTQPCFSYRLSPHRIDFEGVADPTCKYQGTHGFALLDPDGNPTHLERTVPPDQARYRGLADFAAFDFSDITLNGRTYRLSRHLLAEVDEGRTTGHFEATYTHCHLFAATITIGPSTEIPPNTNPKPQ